MTLPLLEKNSGGNTVRAVQALLNGLGYNAGTADGLFGDNTAGAVKRFQTASGIAADGIVGPDTWAALYAGTPGGAQPASAHFKASEFKCHDGTEVPAKFYANLQKLMALLGQRAVRAGLPPVVAVSPPTTKRWAARR